MANILSRKHKKNYALGLSRPREGFLDEDCLKKIASAKETAQTATNISSV